MFLILFRNSILCPQQIFPSLRSPRNIMSNNVSATMCPRLPVPLGTCKDIAPYICHWGVCKYSRHTLSLFIPSVGFGRYHIVLMSCNIFLSFQCIYLDHQDYDGYLQFSIASQLLSVCSKNQFWTRRKADRVNPCQAGAQVMGSCPCTICDGWFPVRKEIHHG